ncbi:MAG: hypothetical protein HFK04_02360 [Oscillospiraceae bacterium]|nr:hypothetical protein [Oscillospiraceae bacterium]
MLIHSIIDPLEMMEKTEDASVWQQVPGGFLQGVQGRNGLAVTRLVSTDPALYLNPQYQPGAIYCPKV